MARAVDPRSTLWTIGHSTHSVEDFLGLLAVWKIETLVDVRRFPGSRRHPQFNDSVLARSLAAAGIIYQPLPQLGGRRPSRPDSINLGWRNAGFRGYADYMQTEEFQRGIEELIALVRNSPSFSPARPERAETCSFPRTVIMCAEAVPWRCHRWLLSDAMLVQGRTIVHILSTKKTQIHTVTAFAKLEEGRLSYPAEIQHPTLF
ncbi:MAG: DUF488 family protein [Nitrospiraceae bacterium]